MKSSTEKTVKIQGKDYVLVADRVLYFNENYPNGSIVSELHRYEDKQIIVKSIVTPDVSVPSRIFTGWAQEIEGVGMVNKTSALENAETSAVGRALGMMGIGVIDAIASVDEINKAKNREYNTGDPVEPKNWKENSDMPWFSGWKETDIEVLNRCAAKYPQGERAKNMRKLYKISKANAEIMESKDVFAEEDFGNPSIPGTMPEGKPF